MNRDQTGLLWESRFRKIVELEKESLSFYRGLLAKHKDVSSSPRFREILEEILDDEERHVVISQELVRIVMRKMKRDQESDGKCV